jgi:hypothetical protein
MSRAFLALTLALAAATVAAPRSGTLDWPYSPGTASYAIGNNFGPYQHYQGYDPYYHNGIDILAGSPGRPVYAIASGIVMRVVTNDDFNSGIVIGTPGDGSPGYAYWHLHRDSIKFAVNQSVTAGDKIGEVVDWDIPDAFDHIHLCKVEGVGKGKVWTTHEIAGDPLADLHPIPDTTKPVIEPLDGTRPFRFSDDATGQYLAGSALKGSVDVIARIGDKVDGHPWKLAPHRVSWTVTPAQAGAPLRVPLLLDGALGAPNDVLATLYRNDATVRSAGDYETREFSFVLTHAHQNRPVVIGHRNGAWNTGSVPNGVYTVRVVAADRAGNEGVATQTVTINNR